MDMSARSFQTGFAALLLAFAAGSGMSNPVLAHDMFSAGMPGDAKKPARIVQVTMRDGDGKMTYDPTRIEVRRNEQIRFVISNSGALPHEFVLASAKENLIHAQMMQRYPDMEHDDPNAKTVPPQGKAEILWRFSQKGTFEFACLIPGHREAGMTGTVVVK
jgi:uncharacterized cupredoxin-like copper-binding protein